MTVQWKHLWRPISHFLHLFSVFRQFLIEPCYLLIDGFSSTVNLNAHSTYVYLNLPNFFQQKSKFKIQNSMSQKWQTIYFQFNTHMFIRPMCLLQMSLECHYSRQWTAEGSVFGTVSLWFCLFMCSGTPEWICAKFALKTCLVPRTDESEGQG